MTERCVLLLTQLSVKSLWRQKKVIEVFSTIAVMTTRWFTLMPDVAPAVAMIQTVITALIVKIQVIPFLLFVLNVVKVLDQ